MKCQEENDMGIYVYTLRAGTKKLGGAATPVEIGQFKFAFKPFWRQDEDRVVQSLLAAGKRARDKLQARGVQLFVKGDWHDGQAVHWAPGAFAELTEEFTSCPHVGWMCKTSNGSWLYLAKTSEQLLRDFPEIGVLHGEDEDGNYQPKYYFTDRDKDGNKRSLQYPPSDNLYQVCSNVQLARLRRY